MERTLLDHWFTILVAAVIGAAVTSYLWPRAPQTLDSCRMEAMKSFGHLRKKNSWGFLAFQSELEDRYVELCMDKHGFTLDTELYKALPQATQIGTMGSEYRDVWMSDPDHWKRTSYWPSLR